MEVYAHGLAALWLTLARSADRSAWKCVDSGRCGRLGPHAPLKCTSWLVYKVPVISLYFPVEPDLPPTRKEFGGVNGVILTSFTESLIQAMSSA